MTETTIAPDAAPKEPVYKHAVNEARGEVRLVIDDTELVIAAELGRLSAVSSRLQCKSLSDLYTRLTNFEVAATVAGVELLTVKGDALAAIGKLKLKHFRICGDAFSDALAHHLEGDEGNE